VGENITIPNSEVSTIIREAVNGAAVLDFTDAEDAVSLTVTNSLLNAISSERVHVEFALPQGSITFGTTAAGNIVQQSRGGNTTTISVREMEIIEFSAEEVRVIGDRPVFELKVINAAGDVVSDFGGPVEVRMPYTRRPGETEQSLIVFHVAEDGTLTKVLNSRYENGYVIFTTNHFSQYMITYNHMTFDDVMVEHWAFTAIGFAAARGLVRGHGDGTFAPEDFTTRAQLAQFVFNAMGIEHAENAGQPYDDVAAGEWYFDTVTTLQQLGILDGFVTVGNWFNPNAAVTRREMALILANVAVYADIAPVHDVDVTRFTDSGLIGENFMDAVVIAINAGLLNPDGMGDGTFSPNTFVTRAQAATIQQSLLRALGRLD
jgi:hypothetical protein